MEKVVSVEGAERVKNLIKPLRDVVELYGWIDHTQKMYRKLKV